MSAFRRLHFVQVPQFFSAQVSELCHRFEHELKVHTGLYHIKQTCIVPGFHFFHVSMATGATGPPETGAMATYAWMKTSFGILAYVCLPPVAQAPGKKAIAQVD